MKNSSYVSIACLASTLILTGCGGGGGGGGAASAPVTGVTPILSGKVAPVTITNGVSIKAGSYAKGMGGTFTITTGTNTDIAGVRTVTSNSMPTDLSVRDVSLNFGANGSTATAVVSGLGNAKVVNLPNVVGQTGITVFADTNDFTGTSSSKMLIANTIGGTSLNNSFTGYIQNKTSNTNTVAVKSISGEITYIYGGVEATNMPTAGSATYNGTYKGIVVANGYSPADQTGAATMNANFGAGTVSGSITQISSNSYSIASPYTTGPTVAATGNVTFNGKITGTQFSGTTAFNSSTPGVTGSGNVSGGFFGAGAPEAAGVMSTRVTSSLGETATMLGTFGMKK